MTAGGDLYARLERLIATAGPIPVAAWMAECNAHYYATRDPLGAAGDFTTAPEISQMFGELIGLWAADLWDRAGRPADVALVELGPGRGTLMADALRAMARVGWSPPVHFVETSPTLRAAQARAVPDAAWHDDVTTLPPDGAVIVVANEFFDALPVRQVVRTRAGWRERMVAHDGARFVPVAGATPIAAAALPPTARDGAIVEASPAGVAIARDLSARIAVQGGALLAIDYGYAGPAVGDTLQGLRAHAPADPFAVPGQVDLTCHVDFTPLAAVARDAGCRVAGPVGQGAFLSALGIAARADTLSRAAPGRAADVASARDRLIGADAMGTLFQVLCVTAPHWPTPAGFAA